MSVADRSGSVRLTFFSFGLFLSDSRVEDLREGARLGGRGGSCEFLYEKGGGVLSTGYECLGLARSVDDGLEWSDLARELEGIDGR